MIEKFVNTETKDKIFFDSNIFVYAMDDNDPQKKAIAGNLIKKYEDSGNVVISTQNLQEFYNVSTKKLHVEKNIAKSAVDYLSKSFPVIQISIPIILKAIDIQIKYQLSFYDSLILSTASYENCVVCYSEDLSNGQIVEGVKVINPFCA